MNTLQLLFTYINRTVCSPTPKQVHTKNVVNEGVQVSEIRRKSVSDDRNCEIPQANRTRIDTPAAVTVHRSF